MEFKNYHEYKQHVIEMWSEGYISELEMDELVYTLKIKEKEKGLFTTKIRLLTEEEYNEKYK